MMQHVGISEEIHYICTVERTSILMAYDIRCMPVSCNIYIGNRFQAFPGTPSTLNDICDDILHGVSCLS